MPDNRALLTLAAIAAAAAIAGCGGDSSASSTAAAPTGPTAVQGCSLERPPAPREMSWDAEPAMTIDPAKTYVATMQTSCGTMNITLDAKNAPHTVNNFVFLAREGFYDGVPFHRIISGFMAQGGDPTGTGGGGPGYEFADEPPSRAYEVGDLAMANAGPDTNGSQFFVITGPQGSALPPSYNLFGKVTNGQDVVQRLDQLGDVNADNGVPPRQPVYITKVTITEK